MKSLNHRVCMIVIVMVTAGVSWTCQASDIAEEFFETQVRPVLLDQCGKCHNRTKRSGGLQIDSRDALIQGGDSGPAIVPGDKAKSLLIQAVRHLGDIEMPPNQPLGEAAIRNLEHWIDTGAYWPATTGAAVESMFDPAHGPTEHWAFQPVVRPPVPSVSTADPERWPIDSFVAATRAEHQLAASPPADRRSLIRRVSYSLTGLPPSMADVERFVADSNPNAYSMLVDRLLDSNHYGEHIARHWLDVARYSDTKGYVYDREERFWPHAWVYRDWVVQAINEDMPYDRFLLLQLAADQVDDRRPDDLAAMGFLTLGRRFLGVDRDIIDDRIDVLCRGTMGLTVACARCHDHKYDPIPTADYYSLYGVIDSSVERLVQLSTDELDGEFSQELQKRQSELEQQMLSARSESSDRARNRVADYLFAQSELDKYPANGFDQIFSKEDLLPAFVRQWERYLWDAKRRNDPIFAAWFPFVEIPKDSFGLQSPKIFRQLQSSATPLHPMVLEHFSTPPQSFRDVCDRYRNIFAAVQQETETDTTKALSDEDRDSLRQVLYGADSPCEIPAGPITESETYYDSDTCTALWKLQGEVDRWIIRSAVPARFALTLVDQDRAAEPRVFRRGNPLQQGDLVPRQFLSILSDADRQPFQNGSGRYELARAIIDPANPLTARVIVNRVWTQLFGQGLVTTPSDFGTRATAPSHPKLLDWLASQLISCNWSLKTLHREIVLSASYQQSSVGPADQAEYLHAMQIDPENRWLWRSNATRLSFEQLRDSMLTATNDLDRSIGGKPTDLFTQPYSKRRTIYGLIDRQFLPGTLRLFDFANPDLHVAKRSETTVPQQALFFLNDPLVLERTRALAKHSADRPDPRERVRSMFLSALQRNPSDPEIDGAIELVNAATENQDMAASATTADWQYGYGSFDEANQSVTFTALPHFTGQAWQGGSQWPDAQLGWVQLTADGGHPGNDRNHAAIRRWTAPCEMQVRIESTLQHEPTQGDGIRGFVVSSQSGLLRAANVHHDSKSLNVDSVDVLQGETIDFIVDIDHVLNSDQYLWSSTISETSAETSMVQWGSLNDFIVTRHNPLDGWEQLAQVLFCSNEFMFID